MAITIAMIIAVAFFLGGATFLWIYFCAFPSFRIQDRTLNDTFAPALMTFVKTHPEVKVALTGVWRCSNRELINKALGFNRFYHGVQSCRMIENDLWKGKLFSAALSKSRKDPCRSGVILSTMTDVFVSFLRNTGAPLPVSRDGSILSPYNQGCYKIKVE